MADAQAFQSRSLKRKNVKGLALNPAASKLQPKPSDGDSQIPGAIGNAESSRTDTLEIGLEFKLDLRSEDLIVLKELGAGNGGTVSKVMHASTKVVMARKIIRVDAKENVRKQILRELQVGHDCNSPYIVTFYGAFQNEARDIVLCMEYMDCGSLDRISKDFGPVRVDVLGKIAESILGGLVYLYETHRIMHRDIKPSNVLVNSRGHIKLCDFGVATETVNSLADTFVGTSTYMAPERIQGSPYSVRSDVWSVGLTIMELAIGKFPFDASDSSAEDRASAGPMGILDLLQTIVHEPAPKLPKSDAFPRILEQFIDKCLLKKPEERPTPRELYDKDAFIQAAKRTPVNLREWAISLMEKHNRKSYLAPPAPRAIKPDGSRDSTAMSPAVENYHPLPDPTAPHPRQQMQSSHHHSQQAPQHTTPASGEIPFNYSREPAHRSNVGSLGLERLSLNKQSHSYNQYQSTSATASPVSGTGSTPYSVTRSQYSSNASSPQYGTRSASSPYYGSRIDVNGKSNGRPPPPTGPLPVPPRPAETTGWRERDRG
ncbi:hypothetical protein VTO42DRAFT_7049 [Malbranchea cinnamomea]